MAHFERTNPAPTVKGDYRSFRPYVRRDFKQYCAYCLLHEDNAAGEENFELDHFHPRKQFKAIEKDFYNLYYSCHPCNRIKWHQWPTPELQAKGIGFVDLCKDNFEDHFREKPDGQWEPLTESARYTLKAIRLNRPHLLKLRERLRSNSS